MRMKAKTAGNDHEIITRRTKLTQSSLCQAIQNKSNTLIIGSTGRAYNCLTSLSSPCRPALRYKGKRLESVDIRNSQPALLGKLVQDKLESRNAKPGNLEATAWENASHIGTSFQDSCALDCSLLGLAELDSDPLGYTAVDCNSPGHTVQEPFPQESEKSSLE